MHYKTAEKRYLRKCNKKSCFLNIFVMGTKIGYCVGMETDAKIVLVDDEIMVTKTLAMLLRLEGLENTIAFNNPEEALGYLEENDCELIISDFIMPQMNGLEFLSAAKKIELHQNTTQILLTGYADKENAIKAINELGIFKYIEKPWNNADLILNIKNAIERTTLKKALKQKMDELEQANSALENYSKNLETLVEKRTGQLYESSEKLNTLFENCADGILTFNRNHQIISANKATQEIFGVSEKELINKNFFELIINEKNQKIEPLFNEKKVVYLRDFSLINYKNDEKIPVEISLGTVLNNKDSFVVAVIRNMSYQKENERLKDDFIATLTHDLRTPLLAAISGLEFILNGTLGAIEDKQKDLIFAMKKSNEDMLGLTNALLEVYRYEAGKVYLCKSQFCINELITQSVSELQPLLIKENAKLNFARTNTDELLINADKNEIRRVIVNLIGNAIKHSGENIQINISAHQEDKDLVVSVKDNGVGLDQEDIKKLFKRFSQGTSKKRSTSTGLGLYLSSQIVNAHNGTIWVESEVDKGSNFIFRLKNVVTESRVLL